ncbi:hypothetical protein ALP39_200158 [Pseudomonas marginalis pv. marginalis]|nr:hypothetical protein ALP39_200158 [Pseudomonas marginalis pv. marginalis]
MKITPNICMLKCTLVLIGVLNSSAIAQAEILAITDRASALSNSPAGRIIFLDEKERLEEQISLELPYDTRQAAASVQAYLSSPAGRKFKSDLLQAQEGVTDAWSLGIEKIPAVVVDRRYVIYGETDVAKAVERINQARGSSQ